MARRMDRLCRRHVLGCDGHAHVWETAADLKLRRISLTRSLPRLVHRGVRLCSGVASESGPVDRIPGSAVSMGVA
jgi:hypothetical protein